MKLVQVMPMIITILSVVTAAVCYGYGDWKRGLYWTGASIIGIAMTL